jgi:hypothetical protein
MGGRPVDVRDVTVQPEDEVFAFGIHPPIAMPRFEMADDAGLDVAPDCHAELPAAMVDGDRLDAIFASAGGGDEIDEEEAVVHAAPQSTRTTSRSDEWENATPRSEERAQAADSHPDMLALAHLCTELGRVESAEDLNALLELSAGTLRARGLIVWVWDESTARLRPGLAHGYSDRVLAQLPALPVDADNATAAAFRAGQACAIPGNERASGALVLPLLAASGCVGVLALELEPRVELSEWLQAVSTILAAMLAQLVDRARAATEVVTDVELAGPLLRAGVR